MYASVGSAYVGGRHGGEQARRGVCGNSNSVAPKSRTSRLFANSAERAQVLVSTVISTIHASIVATPLVAMALSR